MSRAPSEPSWVRNCVITCAVEIVAKEENCQKVMFSRRLCAFRGCKSPRGSVSMHSEYFLPGDCW